MKELTAEQTEAEIGAMLTGQREPADIARFLTDLSERGETVEEIVGAARALRRHMNGIIAPGGSIDCCGTGGDGLHTLNVSTAVAFVVAGSGVPVAKHGNRASSSKCGAADVLEAMGVPLDASLNVLEDALRLTKFCFMLAPMHHRAMAHVAPVRKALNRRTIFNIVGPLANPAKVKRQLVGVYSKNLVRPMAEAMKILGSKAAWVVHGNGMDEVSLSGITHVCELDASGAIQEFELSAADFGLPQTKLNDIKGGDAAFNAAALMHVLNGCDGAYRNTVLANAAAALVMAGETDDLKQAVTMAADSIDGCMALTVFHSYKDSVS